MYAIHLLWQGDYSNFCAGVKEKSQNVVFYELGLVFFFFNLFDKSSAFWFFLFQLK